MKNRKEFLKCYKASCRVQTPKALGSATIVYSKDGETFIITNHHVVENCIEYKEVWSNIMKKKVQKEFTKTVEILFPNLEEDRVREYINVLADIVIYDKEQDMALIKIRNSKDYPAVKWYPKDKVKMLPMCSDLVCIGAALGEKPIVTEGLLNGIEREIDNYEYWLSSAASIYGNSGGGVYTIDEEGNWFFLGIPSRIAVTGSFVAQAITHMGYFIPLHRIYKWLEDNCYQYIYDENFTKAQCDELREAKKEEGLIKQLIKKKL